jgi:hypothetical protein
MTKEEKNLIKPSNQMLEDREEGAWNELKEVLKNRIEEAENGNLIKKSFTQIAEEKLRGMGKL